MEREAAPRGWHAAVSLALSGYSHGDALPPPRWPGHACTTPTAQLAQMRHPWMQSPPFQKVTFPAAELRGAAESNGIKLMRSWPGGLPVS